MIQGIDKLKQKLADDLQVKKQKIDEQTEAEIVKIQEKYAKEILAAQAAEAKWQEQYKEQEAKRLHFTDFVTGSYDEYRFVRFVGLCSYDPSALCGIFRALL